MFSSISESDPVAFIGLGAMGYNMAGRITKRTSNMLVWNRTRNVAERHAEEFGTNIMKMDGDGSLPQLSHVRALFMCLPTSNEVDLVLKQTSLHLRPGTIVVDCTSGNPKQSRLICDRLMQDHGVHFMDCAVSGGPGGASDGTLGAFIGADDVNTYRSVEISPLRSNFGWSCHEGDQQCSERHESFMLRGGTFSTSKVRYFP
jgi:3-hydroxyisobutyrate dehydrogenase-like beta-hydroxyacid dehydrogenase